MAFGRKQRQIEALQYRIKELEERLCPCEEHDWKYIGMFKYKCRRCGKEKWDEKWD